jgi:hypothetical protein
MQENLYINSPKPILVYILTAYQKQKISTGMLSKHNKASTDVYFFLLEFYNVLNDNRSFLSSKIKFPRCELPNKISLFILQRTSRDQTLSEKRYQRVHQKPLKDIKMAKGTKGQTLIYKTLQVMKDEMFGL